MRSTKLHHSVLFSAFMPLFLTSFPLTALSEQPQALYAYEPKVTEEEALLIEKAKELASRDIEASISLLRSQDIENASPALDYALGTFLAQSGKYREAISAYEAALSKLPAFEKALYALAQSSIAVQQYVRAVSACKRLVQTDRADDGVYVLYGHALMLQDRFVLAENAYRKALLLNPENRDALRGLSRTFLEQERYAEADKLLVGLLENNLRNKELWFLRANIYIAKADLERAVSVLESARRASAVDSKMLATLGDLYLGLERPEDAVKAYQEAFQEKTPDVSRMLRASEGFLALGEESKCEEFLNQAIKREKSLTTQEQIRLLRLQGDLLLIKGDYEAALTKYDLLLEEDPLDAKALLSLGDSHRHLGHFEQALISYERAQRIAGFETRALIKQAKIRVDQSEFKKAIELLEASQAIEKKPEIARYLTQLRRLFSNTSKLSTSTQGALEE